MISAPAFVAIRPGGGLIWLQYEFAVPLAMILAMAVLAPYFYRANIITVYEYLERRFDARTRMTFSLVFQLSRALATGIAIYAAGILLSVILETPLWVSILLMGAISLVYTTMGGIAADIWSDVIQLVVLWAGIFVVLWFAVAAGGGWTEVVSHIPIERFRAVDFTSHGLGDGQNFGFWPMVLGGFFLYASYYGCDQSQIQRVLCAESEQKARNSLWLNGLLRFPLVLSYAMVGLVMAGFAAKEPEFAASIPPDHLDYLIPLFIKHYVPSGLTGLILAGMFAAVMSSIDSAFNSLSAATVQDIYVRYVNPHATERQYLFWSRVTTGFWGVLCTGFAFWVGNLAPTVIEGINKIGSAFYGPTLAAFLLAILSRRVGGDGVIWGLLCGVGVNLVLWVGFDDSVSWLWWNAIGCGVALAVALAVGGRESHPEQVERLTMDAGAWREMYREDRARYWILAAYFLLILLVSYGLWFLHIPLPAGPR
jgi:SSS family solute:Na+ symporter